MKKWAYITDNVRHTQEADRWYVSNGILFFYDEHFSLLLAVKNWDILTIEDK